MVTFLRATLGFEQEIMREGGENNASVLVEHR